MPTDIRDVDNVQSHVLYRLFNAEGDLLYIGCTQDLDGRLMLHHVSGYSRIETEVYPNRVTARAAERAAIKAEAPLLNKQHNPTRFRGRPGGGFDMVEPIHPITAEAVRQETKVVTDEDKRAALQAVADRLGLGAA